MNLLVALLSVTVACANAKPEGILWKLPTNSYNGYDPSIDLVSEVLNAKPTKSGDDANNCNVDYGQRYAAVRDYVGDSLAGDVVENNRIGSRAATLKSAISELRESLYPEEPKVVEEIEVEDFETIEDEAMPVEELMPLPEPVYNQQAPQTGGLEPLPQEPIYNEEAPRTGGLDPLPEVLPEPEYIQPAVMPEFNEEGRNRGRGGANPSADQGKRERGRGGAKPSSDQGKKQRRGGTKPSANPDAETERQMIMPEREEVEDAFEAPRGGQRGGRKNGKKNKKGRGEREEKPQKAVRGSKDEKNKKGRSERENKPEKAPRGSTDGKPQKGRGEREEKPQKAVRESKDESGRGNKKPNSDEGVGGRKKGKKTKKESKKSGGRKRGV